MPHDGQAAGHLKIRGPWVAKAYYRDEGGPILDDEGYFDTGDVATIDPDGYMQITDRSKDVIKSGGEWISSIALENAAMGHPLIAEAAVIGIAHPKWQERPLLLVVVKPGQTLEREAVLRYLEGRVAKWWLPDDVVFVTGTAPHRDRQTAQGGVARAVPRLPLPGRLKSSGLLSMTYHSLPNPGDDDPGARIPRRYAWVVFALSFGLLLSDYMSRQVLNAVFPLLKQEWVLSDARLGLLSGIVALMVGLLTFPLSLLADRFGRVKSLTVMATVWSLATLGCGLAQEYPQMLVARFLVGVGEAAYGSVGIAVVLSVFPKHMRATLTGAFMAGGMFGSVLGMALGGAVAAHLGWRWAFAAMALFGLVLALLYPIIVREKRIAPPRPDERALVKAPQHAGREGAATQPGQQPLGGRGLRRQRSAIVRRRHRNRLVTELPQSLLRDGDRCRRRCGGHDRTGRRYGHDRLRHAQ